MKRKLIAIVTGVFAAGLLFTGGVAMAKSGDDPFKKNVSLDKSTVVDGSYYATGQTVTVAGTVKGDVYCAGSSIVVSGTVEGDVLCAGQTVKVSGTVKGNVRVAGQVVTVDGTIAKNVSAFGQTVDIAKTAQIGQDLNGASSSATIDGKVGRDMTFAGSSVNILGMINRNVDATSENLTVNKGASVNGYVHYTSKNSAVIADGTVKGKVEHTKATDDRRKDDGTVAVSSALYMMFAFLLVALTLALVFPQFVDSVGTTGQKRLGLSILSGVVFVFAAPMVVVLIALTVLGIPLAIILGFAWVLVLALSGPLAAYYLGKLLLRNNSTNIVARMMAGAVILAILYVIPVVNIIAGVITLVLGTGMLSLHALSQKKFSYTTK